jgi:hypothetical protein
MHGFFKKPRGRAKDIRLHPLAIDLAGKCYGLWTVEALPPERHRHQHRSRNVSLIYWPCQCACGTRRLVRGDGLRDGTSTNCGCVRREKLRALATKHGMTRSRIYVAWNDMKQRCFNRQNKYYRDYGGRGITVCADWLTFKNFYADMGEPPDGMSLDRINNNGNYESRNCRWATRAMQHANRRRPRRRTKKTPVTCVVPTAAHYEEPPF